MKNLKPKLIKLFKEGYCTPQIARIAKEIDEPSTTIHYNIKSLEKEGTIKTYKAVFDYKKIDEGFCAYVLINNKGEEGARTLAKYKEVESVDIITGDWELIVKVRTKDQNEFYKFLYNLLYKENFQKTLSLVSLKQFKTEFVSYTC